MKEFNVWSPLARRYLGLYIGCVVLMKCSWCSVCWICERGLRERVDCLSRAALSHYNSAIHRARSLAHLVSYTAGFSQRQKASVVSPVGVWSSYPAEINDDSVSWWRKLTFILQIRNVLNIMKCLLCWRFVSTTTAVFKWLNFILLWKIYYFLILSPSEYWGHRCDPLVSKLDSGFMANFGTTVSITVMHLPA